MLKNMGNETYYMFRIPYWDWRKEKQTDNNSLFKSNRLGETIDNNGLPQVHGDLYSEFLNSWETICWQRQETPSHEICDPRIQTGQLQRCPLMGESKPCSSTNDFWPTDKDIQTALSLQAYDKPPFNKMAKNSFRNYLEGFLPLPNDDLQACQDNKLCMCDTGNSNCTENGSGNPIQRLLHNSVST